MISGKLTVRYTTFYSTGRKFRDQKRGTICKKNRQPSQHQFHCCVEPRGLRDVEAFSFGRESVWKKEKIRDGRSDLNRSSSVTWPPTWISHQTRSFRGFSSQILQSPPNTHVPTPLAPLRKERVRAPRRSLSQKYQSVDRRRIYDPRRAR